MKTILYAKDASGSIRFWSIEEGTDGLFITHGTLGGSAQTKIEHIEEGLASRSLEEQIRSRFNSRVKRKLDQGYVYDLERAKYNERTNPLGLLRPMLAQPIKNVKSISYKDAFYQHKYDGNRCLVTMQEGKLLAYTRNGKQITSINHILKGMHLQEGQTIDGELYCHRVKLQTINSWIKKAQPDTLKLSLRVYDIIVDQPYSQRLNTLSALVLGRKAALVPTIRVSLENALQGLLARSIELGYEGGILRWGNTGYEDGKRSKSLAKIKQSNSAEFQVIEALESKDGWARLLLDIGDGTITVSAPGTMEEKYLIAENPEDYIGKIVTVKYFGLTADKKPFHPIAVAFREDI